MSNIKIITDGFGRPKPVKEEELFEYGLAVDGQPIGGIPEIITGGDISGSIENVSVVGIHGNPISNNVHNGETLVYQSGQWQNTPLRDYGSMSYSTMYITEAQLKGGLTNLFLFSTPSNWITIPVIITVGYNNVTTRYSSGTIKLVHGGNGETTTIVDVVAGKLPGNNNDGFVNCIDTISSAYLIKSSAIYLNAAGFNSQGTGNIVLQFLTLTMPSPSNFSND